MGTTKLTIRFADYLAQNNGSRMEIDATDRYMVIYDSAGGQQQMLKIGESTVKAGLELRDLLNTSFKTGSIIYQVLEDGKHGYDWLYATEAGDVL
jgi:hypothetical protein